MHIAVRYEDGTKNLLSYSPSEQYSTEELTAGAKEMLEQSTGKKVAVMLVQVSEKEEQPMEQQTA